MDLRKGVHYTRDRPTPGGLVPQKRDRTYMGVMIMPAFDEEFYLAQNPDVATAVARGEFGSGFEHFQMFFFRIQPTLAMTRVVKS